MLYQHEPLHPMVFEFHVRVVGDVRIEMVRAALDFAALRHPMLLTRLQDGHWVLPPQAQLPLQWGPSRPKTWDLTLEGGARLVVDGALLCFEFHHAVCDGEGASLFVRDFFRAYQAQLGGSPRWKTMQPLLLERRGKLPWPTAAPGKDLSLSVWRHLRHLLDFLRIPPIQIRVGDPPRQPRPRGMRAFTFSREESLALSAQALASGMNLNTVANGLLFECLSRACEQSRRRLPDGCLRVLMPISNRSFSDVRMGAANRICYAFLTRRPRDCVAQRTFLAGLQEEVKFIRRHRPDLILLAGMEAARRFGVLRLLSRWSRLQASAVLSYMGDLSPKGGYERENGCISLGGLLVHSACGTPPVTAGTPIAVGLGRVGDHLSLAWRSSPELFSEEAEAQMFDDYLRGWKRWAGLERDCGAHQEGAGR